MSPADHLAQAGEGLQQVLDKIDEAIPEVDKWALDGLRLLKAELVVSRRRLGNVERVLRGSGRAG